MTFCLNKNYDDLFSELKIINYLINWVKILKILKF
jgi:hypothetical protein